MPKQSVVVCLVKNNRQMTDEALRLSRTIFTKLFTFQTGQIS